MVLTVLLIVVSAAWSGKLEELGDAAPGPKSAAAGKFGAFSLSVIVVTAITAAFV